MLRPEQVSAAIKRGVNQKLPDGHDGRAYPRAVIKAVLAHGKGDAVTAAYLRSGLFEARRKLMEHWSRFATGLLMSQAE
jgi:hypothetical protein